MINPPNTPCGTWTSPVTAASISAGSMRLGSVFMDGESRYWLEGRPQEGGRNVLVRSTVAGVFEDLTPAPYNVRTRVHEYGGGACLVAEGEIFFIHDADQRIYQKPMGASPRALTDEGARRYADLVVDKTRRRLVCVCEDHSAGGEPVNTIIAVGLDGGEVNTLASGHDFYSNPRLSADGSWLSYLVWDHPRMPWDGTELFVSPLADNGDAGEPTLIAGGVSESVFQPEWLADGDLCFVSDRSGWWNLYRSNGESDVNLFPVEAEFGRPQWVFGMRTYGFTGDGRLLAACCRKGAWELHLVDPDTGTVEPVVLPFSDIEDISVSGNAATLLAGAPDRPTAVVALDVSDGSWEVLRTSAVLDLNHAFVSLPEPVRFETAAGQHAHGFYYPPKNPNATPPENEKPPLIVIGHGGPTGATSTTLRLPVQYWTTRGFAVFDVNYRGSTGYGRAYRTALYGMWGVADVEDCVHAARYLARQGLADHDRLIIRGGSAGGYTALAALTFHDVFKAGASYYGIGELEALAKDTHKFESHYLDQLIGPYPDCRDVYAARSPLNHADKLTCPVIFFQGLEDKVVPPNQAEMMVGALKKKRIPVAYLAFEGEQHGFRKAETIRRTLEAELYFYGRVFGFTPDGEIEPVEIMNG